MTDWDKCSIHLPDSGVKSVLVAPVGRASYYGGNFVLYLEADGDVVELKTIDAFRVALVMGSWISCQDTFYCRPLAGSERIGGSGGVGNDYFQWSVVGFCRPSG